LLNPYLKTYDKQLNGDVGQKINAAIIIGEIGKLVDLSEMPNIVERLDQMFKDDNSELRSASSHCLGNISIGNVKFFFPKVLSLI